MQVKKMQYLVIFQCVSNLFVVMQYLLRLEFSAMGICTLGAILTLIIFFYDREGKKVPKPLILVFIVSGIAVTVAVTLMNGSFKPKSDIVPLVAWIVFCLAMMQSRGWIARVLMMINGSLWLIHNLINFDLSLAITYIVLVLTSLIGIVRLDRAEWRAFFARIFGERAKNGGKTEKISEKSEENV